MTPEQRRERVVDQRGLCPLNDPTLVANSVLAFCSRDADLGKPVLT